MNHFDDNPQSSNPDQPADKTPSSGSATNASGDESAGGPTSESLSQLASRIVVHSDQAHPLPSEQPPLSLIADFSSPPLPPAPSFLPEDLRISWSWLHLLLFALFAMGSIVFIQLGLVIYYAGGRHFSQKQMEQLFETKPEVAVGSNVVWFFLIFLFLYVTLAVLRDRPFWPTLGWKKLGAAAGTPTNPWVYFAGGIALAIGVALVSTQIKTPEHIPIQDFLKNRTGAILLMAMAVLVAPLVEETVFRGYLFPLFAATASRIAKSAGADPEAAVRTGTAISIVITGTLFGLLHGAQLGWTWALVAMLSTVGIIFTFARARAGTVLASFLLHLGYNSMIAFSAIVSTRGFTHLPPHP